MQKFIDEVRHLWGYHVFKITVVGIIAVVILVLV